MENAKQIENSSPAQKGAEVYSVNSFKSESNYCFFPNLLYLSSSISHPLNLYFSTLSSSSLPFSNFDLDEEDHNCRGTRFYLSQSCTQNSPNYCGR